MTQKYRDTWEKSFVSILPETFEYDSFEAKDYVKKYGITLKNFMEDPNAEYLVTDEVILAAIVKDDKRDSFLHYFSVKNKKMILLAEPGSGVLFDKYRKSTIVFNDNQIEQKINYGNSIVIIKKRLSEVYTPFTNPAETYGKMQGDGVESVR